VNGDAGDFPRRDLRTQPRQTLPAFLRVACDHKKGTPVRSQQQKAVQKRKERAEGRKDRGKARKGLSEKSIKNLRTTLHTILVYAVKWGYLDRLPTTGGAPPRIVQSLLGHSSIRMTERYAHLAPGQSAAFAHLLSAAAPPPRSTDDPASGPQVGPRPPSPLN